MDRTDRLCKRPLRATLHGLAAVCLLASLHVEAQEVAGVAFNFEGAPLASWIQGVAGLTGRRFVVDPRVKGRVTVKSGTIMLGEQTYEALLTMLREQGFEAVTVGNDVRIAPIGSALSPTELPSRVISSLMPQVLAPPSDGNQFLAPTSSTQDRSQLISLQPVRVAGVQRGFRVFPRGVASEFTRLGFDPGDVVLAINGRRLDDAARSESVFNTAIRAARVTVELERNGALQHLELYTLGGGAVAVQQSSSQ